MTATPTIAEWYAAEDLAHDVAREVASRVPGTQAHVDPMNVDATQWRATASGITVMWGVDTTREGDAVPCLTWAVYDGTSDDPLAYTVDQGAFADESADRLADQMEAEIRHWLDA